MKIHRPLVETIVKSLEEIFLQGYLADKVVSFQLKSNRKLGARDRRFIAEAVYDIVRWWRLISFVLDKQGKDKDNIWSWVGLYFKKNKIELPSWPEFSDVIKVSWPTEEKVNALPRAIRESIPEWLDELGYSQLGIDWERSLDILNKPADVVIRSNSLKINPQELMQRLLKEEIEVKHIDDDAFSLLNRKNLFSTKSYQEGYFEIQDWSSQQVAKLLSPKAGDRVIDACAGAGGKTLHLAAMLKNKGKIVAMDIHAKKLEELKRRARRAGASNIEPRLIESNKTIKRLSSSCDKLLLDVPCSGLGVLRRKPDTKWKLTPEKLLELKSIQLEILKNYSVMLKPGGKMVYSTCSILPSENRQNINLFLDSTNGRFKLLEEQNLLPHKSGYDGFYMALLERIT